MSYLAPVQELNDIRGIDIYLLDLMIKGYVHPASRILDAGCGSARNMHFFLEKGYDITGFDFNEEHIHLLSETYPKQSHRFKLASIDDFTAEHKFDFIICNAVLHFAPSHEIFFRQMEKLTALLSDSGILFIRMTSNIGLEPDVFINEHGRATLPDGSERYLLTHETVQQLQQRFNLDFIEPLKSVNVNNLRCMSNLIMHKKAPDSSEA